MIQSMMICGILASKYKEECHKCHHEKNRKIHMFQASVVNIKIMIHFSFSFIGASEILPISHRISLFFIDVIVFIIDTKAVNKLPNTAKQFVYAKKAGRPFHSFELSGIS